MRPRELGTTHKVHFLAFGGRRATLPYQLFSGLSDKIRQSGKRPISAVQRATSIFPIPRAAVAFRRRFSRTRGQSPPCTASGAGCCRGKKNPVKESEGEGSSSAMGARDERRRGPTSALKSRRRGSASRSCRKRSEEDAEEARLGWGGTRYRSSRTGALSERRKTVTRGKGSTLKWRKGEGSGGVGKVMGQEESRRKGKYERKYPPSLKNPPSHSLKDTITLASRKPTLKHPSPPPTQLTLVQDPRPGLFPETS